MDPIHLEVVRFLRDNGVRRDERLLVAASGGRDSTALLQVLAAIAQPIAVAHVQHGLRGAEAEGDRRLVEAQARALGAPFHTRRVDAARRDARSPEARARALRYAALEEMRADAGCGFVATAHTRDDQAETVLLRAIRGSGPAGLAAIEPRCTVRRLLRPLLGVGREALQAYLHSRAVAWREDATNRDLRLPRNRLRHEALPVLEAAHPGATRKLAELAEAARETEAWIAAPLAAALDDSLERGDGGLWIDPAPLRGLPPALRSRALIELLRRGGLEERLSRRHLQRVLHFLDTDGSGRRLSRPAGRSLWADRDRLWLGVGEGPQFPAPVRVRFSPPQPLALAERGVRFVWSRVRPRRESLDWLCVAPETPLLVRSPAPGDRIDLGRGSRARALKELFASARWSRRERARALVVEESDRVVWVVGLARSPEAARGGRGAWVLGVERLSGVSERC